MTDDTNTLSEAEAKYFETGGKADLPAVETPETPAVEEKPVDKAPEAEAEPVKDKAPKEIEVVSEEDVDAEEPDGRKYVKVGALRKERERLKQEKQARVALEAKVREFEQQLQRLQTPPRQLQPEEVPQVALERVQRLENTLQEQAAKQNFVSTYAKKAQEFIKGTEDEPGVTDFPDAYQHALGVRRSVYETAGYGPEQVAALLESEEAAIVERAMLNGENPAKVIYKIAQKFGYQPKAKEAEADPVKEQVTKQAETADKTLKAAEKLEKIAKGMDKNKSLSGSGGGNEAPSLEELLGMDEAEFTKHTSGAKFKELMGG